jgi:hypothetical protein
MQIKDLNQIQISVRVSIPTFQNLTAEEYFELKKQEDVQTALGDKLTESMFGKNSSFDFVSALMSLQIVRNPDAVLRSVKKDLKTIFRNAINPTLTYQDNRQINDTKRHIKSQFQSYNQTVIFKFILTLLWYTKMPCFDVIGITSEEDDEKSVLKFCKWKGKEISCSAIFQKVTTDSGICCAFNREAADKIYVDSMYTSVVKSLEIEERNLSSENLVPDWYANKEEPTSQPGTKMGLTVMLDAHTDLLADYSISSDLNGFTALVLPPGDFPLTYFGGFEVKPGHNNLVSLSAIQLEADEDIKDISPVKRNCYFPDETHTVKLHKKYSQTNCILECTLSYAQNYLQKVNNISSCTPWYFPFVDEGFRMCDPWEKVDIFEAIENAVPQDACLHCLPDCNRVIYQHTISTQEFRGCDEKNFGMTEFCRLMSLKPKPQIWAADVLSQLGNNISELNYMLTSSQRFFQPQNIYNSSLFNNLSRSYDAYKKDIATLNVFFSSPTALQYSTKQSKSWFDFISTVGGNGGLFIGFSIVTLLEMVWLAIRVAHIYLQP